MGDGKGIGNGSQIAFTADVFFLGEFTAALIKPEAETRMEDSCGMFEGNADRDDMGMFVKNDKVVEDKGDGQAAPLSGGEFVGNSGECTRFATKVWAYSQARSQ